MNIYYLLPSRWNDDKPYYTKNKEPYYSLLLDFFKRNNLKKENPYYHQQLLMYFTEDEINKTPKYIAYNLDLYSFFDYQFFYKLTETHIITHRVFFDYNLLQANPCRYNPNDSMIMLDEFGLNVDSIKNQHTWQFVRNFDEVPEFISPDRYILHPIKDFFDFNWNDFFEKNDLVRIYFEKYTKLTENEVCILTNIVRWLRFFYDFNDYNKSPKKIVSQIKKFIKDMTVNNIEFAGTLFYEIRTAKKYQKNLITNF
jgi:hypothetical protein